MEIKCYKSEIRIRIRQAAHSLERAFNCMEMRNRTKFMWLYFTYTSIQEKTSVGLNIELCYEYKSGAFSLA